MIPKKFYIFDLQFSTKFMFSLVEVNQASISLVVSISATMKCSCSLLGLHTTNCHSDKIFVWFKTHFNIKKMENEKVDLYIHPYYSFLGHFYPNLLKDPYSQIYHRLSVMIPKKFYFEFTVFNQICVFSCRSKSSKY